MELINIEQTYSAKNYQPYPLVIKKGQGAYLWDESNNRYLDMMSAYSVTSCGHSHPRLVEALCHQARELASVSRSFYSDKLGPFLKLACEIFAQDAALPMNTGVEAVETALKAARKWAYTVKGVDQDQAEIIACDGNYHGRTLGAISLSTSLQMKEHFGPFSAGTVTVPFGDIEALHAAINKNTAAFIVEPIQGAGGVIVPPPGYLKECAKICAENKVLLLCDEIQVGLGRVGKWLACQHDDVAPDGVILGKALGGGLLPVSLFLAKKELMDVFTPGDHGSTFGGNPLAAAVGHATLSLFKEEKLIERAMKLGQILTDRLAAMKSPYIKEIRGKGLFYAIELDTQKISGEELCGRLIAKGMIVRFHHSFILLAPPFVITADELNWAIDEIQAELETLNAP